jgi:hypothetical protein
VNYDRLVYDTRDRMRQLLVRLTNDTDKAGKPVCDRWYPEQIVNAFEEHYKAWDELTNCLIRQREERDEQIRRLIDELAEAKKGR